MGGGLTGRRKRMTTERSSTRMRTRTRMFSKVNPRLPRTRRAPATKSMTLNHLFRLDRPRLWPLPGRTRFIPSRPLHSFPRVPILPTPLPFSPQIPYRPLPCILPQFPHALSRPAALLVCSRHPVHHRLYVHLPPQGRADVLRSSVSLLLPDVSPSPPSSRHQTSRWRRKSLFDLAALAVS